MTKFVEPIAWTQIITGATGMRVTAYGVFTMEGELKRFKLKDYGGWYRAKEKAEEYRDYINDMNARLINREI